MTRKPGTGGTRRQAPGAASSTSGHDSPATKARLALPADLGRSLRLLDDNTLDRLVKAAIEEARRRGREMPQGSVDENRPAEPSGAAKGRSKKAGAVTPGQQRLILAAFETGLKPAVIAREFRLSRPTVQHVITGAQRDRLSASSSVGKAHRAGRERRNRQAKTVQF